MNITAARARLQESLLVELICSDLPAWYRRALLRQEMSSLDDASANEFLERVLGRHGHPNRSVLPP